MKLWTDDGRTDVWTTEPAYTISSPGAFGSGKLKWSRHRQILPRIFSFGTNLCSLSESPCYDYVAMVIYVYTESNLVILAIFRYLFLPIVKVEQDKVLIINLLITHNKDMKRS